MAELGLSDDAYRTYQELERDEARWPVLDVVEDALEAIAADPGHRSNRQRRFQDPPCFAVPVTTAEGDWVVLWRQVTLEDVFADLDAGDVYVLYIGRLP
ncbi:MAG: hypothetical protein EA388_14815 [Nitriliruptor sp.]|nr:MAG: hypothetical protein EA388_14815 [Nitriliruptor sp.]